MLIGGIIKRWLYPIAQMTETSRIIILMMWMSNNEMIFEISCKKLVKKIIVYFDLVIMEKYKKENLGWFDMLEIIIWLDILKVRYKTSDS